MATDILQDLRTNAAKDKLPIPTAHHNTVTPYFPESAKQATHVMQRIGKPLPLGPRYDGPFKIEERIGNSCLKLRVGNWANGQPRHELAHWNNCIPYPLDAPLVEAAKAKRGRKPLNANAPVFMPK